MHSLQQNHNYI